MAKRVKFGGGADVSDVLSELESGLAIDEHRLDDALQQQPDLFYRVSKEVALLTSRRDYLKQAIAETEAAVDLEIRAAAEKRDAKATEKAVEAERKSHPRVKKAIADFLQVSQQQALALALKEAFQQRSYVLKDLVSLYMANYFSDQSDRADRGDMKTFKAERNKRRLRNARAERNED